MQIAVAHMESISDKVEFSKGDIEPLITTAMTTLSSKIINVCWTSVALKSKHRVPMIFVEC